MLNIRPGFLLAPRCLAREEGQLAMPKELLIKSGHVITVDPELGDLPGGDVLVSDGVITAVGTGLKPATADAEVIDAAGRLVIPGLVDTHRHVWQGAIGGYTPQITGAGYGPAVLTGIALRHTPDDVYAGTLWGALQAIDAGITTIADWAHNDQSPAHADADLRGLLDSGIRGYFLYGGPGPATDDPNPPHPADARRMRDEFFATGSHGRLRMGMALRGPAFTSKDRNAADFAFARDLELPISIHAGMAGTGHAITVLERDGLLGPDINYVHGYYLTDQEWDLVAASGGTVTITPSTDMLMQFGTFPATGAAFSRGIVSGLGIDTICSAGTDLFSEMRLALAAERSRANADAISSSVMAKTVDLHPRDMLRLATLDGARVWHLEDQVGTITPGKQADITIIDMRSPHLDGFGDPVAVMVLGAGPADVETVIVGGDILKRDGRLTGDRAARARELMHATRQRLHA
jgi:5-methylthioadenosine/S-adenosylhomocysteine deaminase